MIGYCPLFDLQSGHTQNHFVVIGKTFGTLRTELHKHLNTSKKIHRELFLSLHCKTNPLTNTLKMTWLYIIYEKYQILILFA